MDSEPPRRPPAGRCVSVAPVSVKSSDLSVLGNHGNSDEVLSRQGERDGGWRNTFRTVGNLSSSEPNHFLHTPGIIL